MAATGSTATTSAAPQARQAREKMPVPAPTSSTRAPATGIAETARRHPSSTSSASVRLVAYRPAAAR
jgi:hypothetical protein